MEVVDAPFAGAAELLRSDPPIDRAYRRLLRVLMTTAVPRQTKQKSSSAYVFDQRELQALLRSQLLGIGWSHGRALSEDVSYDRVRIRGFQADMLGEGLHVILDYGNRSSWAHNVLTRMLGTVARDWARLTVLVTPTDSLARKIDSNLGTFERVAVSLRAIERWNPTALPGPLILVGTSPDSSLA